MFDSKKYKSEWYAEKKKDPEWWANRKAKQKKYSLENKDNILKYRRKLAKEKRFKAFEHYSKGKPKCACCGEEEFHFLTLDHINGGGRVERKKLGSYLYFFYVLEKRGYPKNYQVLCYNCNCVKRVLGFCPHTNIAVST